MDFNLSSDQQLLVDSAISFCRNQSPVSRVRKMRETPTGWDSATWKAMAELGWLGLPFPESVGGFGGTFVEAGLLLEQFGSTLVPEPYLESAILAGMAVSHGATPQQASEILGPMFEGKTSLALAWSEDATRFDPAFVAMRAEKAGNAYKLTGRKTWVLNGQAAETLIVAARTGGAPGDLRGISLFAIPRTASGVAIRDAKTIDGHRAAFVELTGAEGKLLGTDGASGAAIETALDLAAAGACAEGSGLMNTMLWMTVTYLTQREQFGVKIGTFQALQHRAVDMFVETQLAKSCAMLAMIKAGESDAKDRQSSISAAKAHLSMGGKFVAQQAIQLHGGIGVTDEHDVGLYFKRMNALQVLFGDEEFHSARFARLSG